MTAKQASTPAKGKRSTDKGVVLTAPLAASQGNKAMEFGVSQLSGDKPAAIDYTQLPEFKAALAAEAAKLAAKSAPKEKKERAPKIQQNGISRPAEGTMCAKVWTAADQITASIGSTATVSLLKATLPDVNDHTLKTQYARWRQFNGVVGRVTLPAGAVEAIQEAKANAEAE